MNPTLIRTLQVGVALIVIVLVTLATLLILGMLEQDAALRIGLNVTAVIVVFMAGGLGLSVLFSSGTGSQRATKSERSIHNRDKA